MPHSPSQALQFLTTREAAGILRVEPATLANWRTQEDQGPPFRKHGGRVVYLLDELKAWSLGKARDKLE